MATPHVSGALALLIEWANNEFERKLTETEYYSQLIKCTVPFTLSRALQGNGYVYINVHSINKKNKAIKKDIK